jgi:flagellar biosynthetic protein FlhB
MGRRLAEQGLRLMAVALPVGAVMMAAAMAAAVASGGWNLSWQAAAPRWSKLNPLAGLGRLVSREHLLDMLKMLLLASVLAATGAGWLKAHLGDFHASLAMGLPQALAHTADTLGGGFGLLLLCLAAFALVDLPLQRWNLSQRLRMSREEQKQEMKEMEGQAEVKGRMRARMRELARRRMLAAVPGADMVVMNPSHYAVALKYDEARGGAPRVLAKGADLLALKIRDIARDAGVPVLQAPPLARALYAHTELDQEIPAALFAAVAQVLAHVFQLRAALAGRADMPGALPDIVLPPGLDPLAAGAEPA